MSSLQEPLIFSIFACKVLQPKFGVKMEKFPGWDSKAIARISKQYYGSLAVMFEKHDWSERGSKMMISAPRRIKEHYGSIEAFVIEHEKE